MCGIVGEYVRSHARSPELRQHLLCMNELLSHRGPDGEGIWTHSNEFIGFGHKRLSIIDQATGAQPMTDGEGNWLTYNGEIYNFIELRKEIGVKEFRTQSDSEVILRAYRKWGIDCVSHFRGMFAFALWDEKNQTLVCARDRLGIKPLYYTIQNGSFLFASEVKALLPLMPELEIDLDSFSEYLTFQFPLGARTLYKDIKQLEPGHILICSQDRIRSERYWEVYYEFDEEHTGKYFTRKLNELINESVDLHLRSDVPVGAYVSGGLDSSIVASLASRRAPDLKTFTGKYDAQGFDESRYARDLAKFCDIELYETTIGPEDFAENIQKVMYHMDYPLAGVGVIGQFMVSKLASQYCKVVLGGQGGDEIFGGYARYLVAYFEQCIKGAIDGTLNDGNYIVTYESIIPNLTALQQYKPMLKSFWSQGLFEPMDKRYFQLINRAPSLGAEVHWEYLNRELPYETFQKLFRSKNTTNDSYFGRMTHFDLKTLLPALLHIEDRVSMAHGLEARVPLLDHPIIELAASMPGMVKFKDGEMKYALRHAMKRDLPNSIWDRKDKMGFPVPFTDWIKNELKGFFRDVFSSRAARERALIDNDRVVNDLDKEGKYSRKIWGLFCLEMWQREFIDQAARYREMLKQEYPDQPSQAEHTPETVIIELDSHREEYDEEGSEESERPNTLGEKLT